MKIKWQTLITRGDGKVSLYRVRKFSAILMGWLGVGVLVGGAFLTAVPIDKLALVSAVLVAPMTGGQVADAIRGKFLSDKIEAGEASGRRASD